LTGFLSFLATLDAGFDCTGDFVAGKRGVLVAQLGFLLDLLFGKLSYVGLGVALVPREATSEVAPVEPLLDCVEKQLLILITTENEASNERSTVILVRRHIFNKEL
jgi:hypothetical protein